jgi:endogenous inhibitor of DNA gyrase (YacG/DUF329 family)
MSVLVVKCPTCQRPVTWTTDNAFKPFCSERCKLIDLGEWVMEEKRIAGESVLVESDNEELTFFQ